MRDFTFKEYNKLLTTIGPGNWTVKNYIKNNNSKFIIRHDVDRSPKNALKLALLEKTAGISTTYYFRVRPYLFNKEIIGKIYELGHEVGYHYEVMDKAKGDFTKAKEIFIKEWQLFSQWRSKTAAMHGSSLTKYNNLDFWKKNDINDFNMTGEAYVSIDFNEINYFTDTGRGWNTSLSFKDKGNKELINISDTSSLINLINTSVNKFYIMTHPCFWSNSYIHWVTNQTLEYFVNGIKKIMLKKRNRNYIINNAEK